MPEVWEETRGRRGVLGILALVLFVVALAMMVSDVVGLYSHIDGLRRANAGNNFALLGVSAGGNARLFELLSFWGVILLVLGLAAWATRGKKRMVRRS